jgi:DNA-binding LacI/PurR family transcriptional regulator
LLANGHRHAAFFSPYHATSWSKRRYNGLVRAYAETGLPLETSSEQVQSLRDPSTGVSAVLFSLDKIPDSMKLDETTEETLRSFNAAFHRVSDTVKSAGLVWIRISVEQNILYEKIMRAMFPLFEKALHAGHISAWVGVNDIIAIFGLQFLAGNRRKVPESVSMIGCDDSEFAFQYGLSSYNFMFSSMSSRAMAFLLDPLNKAFAAARIIECDGTVVQRATSGVFPSRPVPAPQRRA